MNKYMTKNKMPILIVDVQFQYWSVYLLATMFVCICVNINRADTSIRNAT